MLESFSVLITQYFGKSVTQTELICHSEWIQFLTALHHFCFKTWKMCVTSSAEAHFLTDSDGQLLNWSKGQLKSLNEGMGQPHSALW